MLRRGVKFNESDLSYVFITGTYSVNLINVQLKFELVWKNNLIRIRNEEESKCIWFLYFFLI